MDILLNELLVESNNQNKIRVMEIIDILSANPLDDISMKRIIDVVYSVKDVSKLDFFENELGSYISQSIDTLYDIDSYIFHTFRYSNAKVSNNKTDMMYHLSKLVKLNIPNSWNKYNIFNFSSTALKHREYFQDLVDIESKIIDLMSNTEIVVIPGD